MFRLLTILFSVLISTILWSQSLFLEAESFTHKGGWLVDQQFMDQMGSPFLLAHGIGTPVEDAKQRAEFPKTGEYVVYVRTWNWNSPWNADVAPGTFQIVVNGVALPETLGVRGAQWGWQYAGAVNINKIKTEIALHDLTGFDGRCDAIYFTQDKKDVPPNENPEMATFRKRKLGLPDIPPDAGQYDAVVVGGGTAGMSAAITCARLGLKTALLQNRPVLGGNNSTEIKVVIQGGYNIEPYPNVGHVVAELGNIYQQLSARVDSLFQIEENLDLFFNLHAFQVEKQSDNIRAVYARHIESNKEWRFPADYVIDCTGDGNVGFLAGADYRYGREASSEFNEDLAPYEADSLVLGTTVKWSSAVVDEPVDVPNLPWAVQFNDNTTQREFQSSWNWEFGFLYHQIDDFEYIRDYAFRVIYGNWAFLKNQARDNEAFQNRDLTWVAHIGGKRESRRLMGDVILTQNDILGNWKNYDDLTLTATYSIDQHFPRHEISLYFPGEEFRSIQKHNHHDIGIPQSECTDLNGPYQIPYRCLYSRNVNNLFMAGRCISVSHIALASVRVQGTTGMMGEVVGMAASVAKKHNCTPRQVYQHHFDELITLMQQGVAKKDPS
jgi:hypothetical protein